MSGCGVVLRVRHLVDETISNSHTSYGQ